MKQFGPAHLLILVALMAVGCGASQDSQTQHDNRAARQDAAQIKSVVIHIEGFKRSKSGAI